MEFKLFSYEYYDKMLNIIVPLKFNTGVANHEDIKQDLFLVIIDLEDKILNKDIIIKTDIDDYIFKYIHYTCRRIIRTYLYKHNEVNSNNYDYLAEYYRSRLDDPEELIYIIDYIQRLNLSNSTLKCIGDIIGLTLVDDGKGVISYSKNTFSNAVTKIKKEGGIYGNHKS